MSITRRNAPPNPTPPAAAAAPDAEAPQPGTARYRPHILYVEDEDVNWEIAAKRLAARYEIKRAANSKQAFAMLEQQKFDAILMDIQLHGSDFDGVQITRILTGRSSNPNAPKVVSLAPIIFVTAYSARYSKEELLEQGGHELISKPIDFVQLTSTLTRIILRQIPL